MASVFRQRIAALKEADRAAARIELIEYLEDAAEATRGDSVVLSLLAEETERLGDAAVAEEQLRIALAAKPTDSRARDHLSRLLMEAGKLEEASEIIAMGIKLDATNWRLHRNQARLLDMQGAKPEAVKATYDTTVRYRQGDAELLIEYGAFLFRLGEYKRAQSKFVEANKAEMLKKRPSRPYIWRHDANQRRVFRGKVQSISCNIGQVVASPEGFKARFWRTDPRSQTLRQGDAVDFSGQFNSMGAEALIRHPKPPA